MLRLILQNLRNSVNAARTAAASNVSVTVSTTQNVQRRSIAVSSAVNLKQSKTISVTVLVFLVTLKKKKLTNYSSAHCLTVCVVCHCQYSLHLLLLPVKDWRQSDRCKSCNDVCLKGGHGQHRHCHYHCAKVVLKMCYKYKYSSWSWSKLSNNIVVLLYICF